MVHFDSTLSDMEERLKNLIKTPPNLNEPSQRIVDALQTINASFIGFKQQIEDLTKTPPQEKSLFPLLPIPPVIQGVAGQKKQNLSFVKEKEYYNLPLIFNSSRVRYSNLSDIFGNTFNKISMVAIMCDIALQSKSWLFYPINKRFIDKANTLPLNTLDIPQLQKGCPLISENHIPDSIRNAADFEWHYQNANFWGNAPRHFLSSGFVRPNVAIRSSVEDWFHSLDRTKPLVAIHKRRLEGYCIPWVLQGRPKMNSRICFADYDWTVSMLRRYGLDPNSVYVYVAWDHEGPKEEYHSFEKFGARFLKPLQGWDVLHDSWVLVKADYLIVNTASSVDQAVVEMRKSFNPSGQYLVDFLDDDCEPSFDDNPDLRQVFPNGRTVSDGTPTYYNCQVS